jgi:dolichyl-phosphate beta-glucosyltransferase
VRSSSASHATPIRAPHLTIIIPAFNEAERLPATLTRLASWSHSQVFAPGPHSPSAVEIIVVDDGSRDATTSIALHHPARASLVNASPRLAFRVIRLPLNRGKGAAVKAGVSAAIGDVILFCDADLSTPIEHYLDLAAALSTDTPIAIGSRTMPLSTIELERPTHRIAMSRVFNRVARLATGVQVSDALCGFKLFERKAAHAVFASLQTQGFAFDVELLSVARRFGLTVAEVPITWRHDPRSTIRPFRDALIALRDLGRLALHRNNLDRRR